MAFVARANRPQMPGIKRVGIKHEAIMNFLLANPRVKMKEVAQHFQVTQPWLSSVVHSDAFQRMLREKQECFFDTSVLPAMDKVNSAAEMALDRMLELIPLEDDLAKLNAVADKALNRLGYGTNTTAPSVNVEVHVGREMLEKARSLIGVRAGASTLEVSFDEAGLANQVQVGGECPVGETYEATAISTQEWEDPSRADGGSV